MVLRRTMVTSVTAVVAVVGAVVAAAGPTTTSRSEAWSIDVRFARTRTVEARRLQAAVGRAGDQRVRLADHADRVADHRGADARASSRRSSACSRRCSSRPAWCSRCSPAASRSIAARKRRILIGAEPRACGARGVAHDRVVVGVLSVTHVVISWARWSGRRARCSKLTDVAYLPALIGKRDLAEGNAKLETIEAIAEISGPASAGALIAAFGAPFAVALDAASYLWSAFMLAGVIRAQDTPAVRRDAIVGDDDYDDAPAAWEMRDLRVGLRAVFEPSQRAAARAVADGVVGRRGVLPRRPTRCTACGRSAMSDTAFGVIIANMGGVGSLGGALMSRVLVSLQARARAHVARDLGAVDGVRAVHPDRGMTTGASFAMFRVSGRANEAARRWLLGRVLHPGGHAAPDRAAARRARARERGDPRLHGGHRAGRRDRRGVDRAGRVGIRTAMWIGVMIGLLVPVLLWRCGGWW